MKLILPFAEGENNKVKRKVSAVILIILLTASAFSNPNNIFYTEVKASSADTALYATNFHNMSFGKQTNIIRVSDYGAAGDGITDDSAAFGRACDEFIKAGENAALILDNKTYYLENCEPGKYAITASGMRNSSILGNDATILVGGNMKSMNINNCENLYISGLNFDRKLSSHFVGTILSIDKENHYFRVQADRNINLTGTYLFKDDEFALKNIENETSRTYLFLNKISVFNQKFRTYDVYVEPNGYLYTETNFQNCSVGDKVIIPTPGVGHIGNETISISKNSNIALESVNLYNYAHFGFVVSANREKIVFSNVNLCPAKDESVVFTGWRDGFHCKYNTASLIWNNCKITGLGDDIINISANMMYVSEVINSHEICCYWSLLNGESYGDVQIGSKAVIFNSKTGELLGTSTITEVVDKNTNHYILADDIRNLTSGENICFYIDSHAAPNSQIVDCNFEGTLRFKGAGGMVKNTRLKMLALVLYPEDNVEGPIPHDITFSSCDFTGSWANSVRASAHSPLKEIRDGSYKLDNIRFQYCKGLTENMFQNQSNFDSASPDYLMINPSIGYETKGKKDRNIRLGVSNGYKNGKQIAKLVITSDFLCDGFSATLTFNSEKLKYTGVSKNAKQIDSETLKLAAIGNVLTGNGRMTVLEFETDGIAKGTDFMLSDVKAVANKEASYTMAGYITRLHGDSNSDDRIDLTDLIRTKKVIAGAAEVWGDGADCNSDNAVNATDLSSIKKYLLGVDGAFD